MQTTGNETKEVLNVAIIGAGFYGLMAARTYLQLKPDTRLAIFERESSVGGTWSRDRIYPNLVAQVEHGYFNYPGTPMPKDGATNNNLVSGEMIFKYLDKFAEDEDLKSHIRFQTWVSNIERCPEGWKLVANGAAVWSKKLIIATGVTSIKNSPPFKVKENSIPVIHSLDIAANATTFSKDENHRFIVVGAAKSAYDVVYHLCTLGKKVTWIIRPEGSGPMPIMPPDVLGKNTITLSSNRMTSYLSPSLMTTNSTLGAFFHRTGLGRSLTKLFWNFITDQAEKAAGFGSGDSNVEGLRPDVRDASCFWCDSSIGLITMSDFWATLKKGDVAILRENVDSVDAAGATLRSGKTVETQYIIYCTGWGDHFSFFSPEMKDELGIPQYGAAVPQRHPAKSGDSNNWQVRDNLADAVVVRKLPLLAAGPKDFRKPKPNRVRTQRRWRLYNRCVPVAMAKHDDRSLVILGQIHTTQTPTIAAIQSLWAIAYLLGEIDLPDDDAMAQEVAEWNAWTRKRYLGVGERYPYALFDWIPYLDRLLSDLGIESRRKKGVISNFLEPHGPHDYSTVLEEYITARRNKRGEPSKNSIASSVYEV